MKKKLFIAFIVIIFICFICTGMSFLFAWGMKSFTKVEGSGVITERNEDLGAIEKIELNIDAEVTLIESMDRNYIVITGDDNIVNILNISEGKNLKISYSSEFPYMLGRRYEPTQRLKVQIFFDNIQELTANSSLDITLTEDSKTITSKDFKITNNGSGHIEVKVSVDEMNIENNGSGIILVKGATQNLEVDSNGSGIVDANDLEAQEAKVTNNGSGKVSIYVENKLEIELNGSGDVVYSGNPKDFTQDVNGSGDVVRK